MIKKTKIVKIYGRLIKVAIVLLTFIFIYRRIFIRDNLDEVMLRYNFEINNHNFVLLSVIVFLLMILNWSIETVKWQYLIKKIESVPFFKALNAIFSGITVSIFTPNRVGEYAGRVFVLEHADRWKGVLITILGSFCQLLVTIVFGAISFVVFLHSESANYFIGDYAIYGLSFLILFLAALLIFLYFNIGILSLLINKLPKRLKKIKRYGLIYSRYSKKELAVVLLLSTLRYFVFITQFYLLLNLFNINIPYIDTFYIMSLVYITMSAIPTITLTELGIRGSVSLYFFGLYLSNRGELPGSYELGIVTVSSLLWLLNLALPALVGAVFVFRLKFFRKNEFND